MRLDWFIDRIENLPHGSGINGDWIITIDTKGNIILENTYDVMSEYGYYVRYIDFKVSVPKEYINGTVFSTLSYPIRVSFPGSNSGDRYWIKKTDLDNYLSEVFYNHFE